MVLVIDNYDSFTYNLVQHLGELGADVRVFRNDRITLAGIERLQPACLVISPGPCTPAEAGVSVAAVKTFAGRWPILGVCLGHQSIACAFGGSVVRAAQVMHGKTSMIHHDGEGVYRGVVNPLVATRYHSLYVSRSDIPACLRECSWTLDADGQKGEIMGLRHRDYPVEGVQFHPESILTPDGRTVLKNFLETGVD